ncbi:PREDICTED: uncharacterized protein LOC106814524 [Priapulus caudatus]|uniref:Uncharacterized protein LOC106814524 n=1 Tax=Priapulus caudatus TaxID=37621 RepID=A0ABM1EQ55_PRICU|nr:PREDICTED: uncharacterized protein LOC106814524 [Priapulus caudatus]
MLKRVRLGLEPDRNERQGKEFEELVKALADLSGSTAISELKFRCGICRESYKICGDRSASGRITYFKKVHFDNCSRKRSEAEKEAKSSSKITMFLKVKPQSNVGSSADEDIDRICDLDGVDMVAPELEDESVIRSDIDTTFAVDMDIDENLVALEDHKLADPTDTASPCKEEFDTAGNTSTQEDSDDESHEYRFFPFTIQQPDPLAKKLQDLIDQGKIPEDCIMYKFLDNTTSYALLDPKTKSDFKWDTDVLEFFETIKYLGGERTANFICGPGFHGTGRGGTKEFKTYADFNLGGPSEYATRKCHAGYTTKSGVIKQILQSFYSLTSHPAAQVSPIISSPVVNVIPVSLASDGTALKAGLEFDTVSKEIVGATFNIDKRYVVEHPDSETEEMKKHIKETLITEVNVTYMTSLDSGASIPVAVHYMNKSTTGDQMIRLYTNIVEMVQTCSKCLTNTESFDHVIEHSNCSSYCNVCLDTQTVCPKCREVGQVSYHPSLRACDVCVESKTKCSKLAVLLLTSDCEEKNKAALTYFQGERNTNYNLSMLSSIPDAVHVGKSLKCSWANWFVLFKGERSNLVLLRTLRDHAEPEVRSVLRKNLTLECVRNKDRMAVEPIVKLTRPVILQTLASIDKVVHTILPETYRFWKTNVPGTYQHPVAVCCGPAGNLLVINFHQTHGQLLQLRLHNPVDVTVLRKDLSKPIDVCYASGLAFVAEQGHRSMRYVDIQCARMKVSSLKTRAQLEEQLRSLDMPINGNVGVLRERLKEVVKTTKTSGNRGILELSPEGIVPAALASIDDDTLLCADDKKKQINFIQLSITCVSVGGQVMKYYDYPRGVLTGLSLDSRNDIVYLASNLGLHQIDAEEDRLLLANLSPGCTEISSLSVMADKLVFTDRGARQVKIRSNKQVTVIAGSGEEHMRDGTGRNCGFVQIYGVCVEANTIYVTDGACGKVKLISGLGGTIPFLQSLGSLYDTFKIHVKGCTATDCRLDEAVANVEQIKVKQHGIIRTAKESQGITQQTNGPQGTISAKTALSLELLEHGMKNMQQLVLEVNPNFIENIDLTTCLTTVVENLHAVSHFKHETFSVLQYARDFATILKESLKRTTKWAAKYYTHPKSYYPVPQLNMAFQEIKYMSPLPAAAKITVQEEKDMKEWADLYRPIRQRAVRDDHTKDKAGVLPIAVYAAKKQTVSKIFLSDTRPAIEVANPGTADQTTDDDGGIAEVVNPGTADQTTDDDGGTAEVGNPGTADQTTDDDGGTAEVVNPGTADQTTDDDVGTAEVVNPGTADQTTDDGGGTAEVVNPDTADQTTDDDGGTAVTPTRPIVTDDEYETSSDVSDYEEEIMMCEFRSRAQLTRSGRAVKAAIRLDL